MKEDVKGLLNFIVDEWQEDIMEVGKTYELQVIILPRKDGVYGDNVRLKEIKFLTNK